MSILAYLFYTGDERTNDSLWNIKFYDKQTTIVFVIILFLKNIKIYNHLFLTLMLKMKETKSNIMKLIVKELLLNIVKHN